MQSQLYSAFPYRGDGPVPTHLSGPLVDSCLLAPYVSCTRKVLVSVDIDCLTFSQLCSYSWSPHCCSKTLLINEVSSDSSISNVVETFFCQICGIPNTPTDSLHMSRDSVTFSHKSPPLTVFVKYCILPSSPCC